jgi:hypothetical protein
MQKMIAIMQGHQPHPSAAGPTSDLRFLAACADRVERERAENRKHEMREEDRGRRRRQDHRGRSGVET